MSPIYFSVVLPAYNTPPDILRRAIDSVLNQTYPHFELIIIDDGSEPSLEPIIREYTDERIVFIRHPENRGAGAAHNSGIKAAKYDWIAFICHDDEWLPNKLEVCVPYIEQNYPEYKFFFHFPIVIGDLKEIEKSPFYNPKPNTGNYYTNFLLDIDRIIQTSCIIVNKECFNNYGYYDETGVLIDWDIYLQFSKYIDFYCINELLSKYYLSPLGITQGDFLILGDKAGNDLLKLILKWQKEIKKSKEARKTWSIRLNAMAKIYIDKNNKKKANQLYWLAIKLSPFWRGNYIDFVKYMFKK
ncbi:MAG TPA: glycosyltransferase [Thermoanaerobacterales bacterium]|jgi:glycosyltransferase involved in cell wall biosynthesis|nr:glycosyltransferase [Thermoanaerobacterales bacterium]